jgi:L-ascorbate metabolism protein UlaG (beta-lactamase superfamily)
MSARIMYVGHATVLVDMDGVRVLTDPLLRTRLLHLRRVGRVDTVEPDSVDAVLVSHLHFDHLDFPSLQRLGRDVPVVVPRGARTLLENKGFRSVTEVEAGDEIAIGSLAVRGTPAIHDPRRLPFGARAAPLGYEITGSRSVYFAGDTDLFDGMAELGPVDVALLPIWGWGPSLGPGHMSPREAAEAAQLLQATVAIPMHWGTFFPLHTALRGKPAFIDRPLTEFEAEMEALAPATEVRALRPGEETIV